jgi:hypothetical protein
MNEPLYSDADMNNIIKMSGMEMEQEQRSWLRNELQDKAAFAFTWYWNRSEKLTQSELTKQLDDVANAAKRLRLNLMDAVEMPIRYAARCAALDAGSEGDDVLKAPLVARTDYVSLVDTLRLLEQCASDAAEKAHSQVTNSHNRHRGDQAARQFVEDLALIWLRLRREWPSSGNTASPFFLFVPACYRPIIRNGIVTDAPPESTLRDYLNQSPARSFIREAETFFAATESTLKTI